MTDIFEGVELCDWPTTPDWRVAQQYFKSGLVAQNQHLCGTRFSERGKWYEVKKDGVYFCQVRAFGIALVLGDAGHTTFKASSPREAARIYGKLQDAHAKFAPQIKDLAKRMVYKP